MLQNYKTTIKHCLFAQEFSDAAKMNYHDEMINYRKIKKIIDRYSCWEDISEWLYVEKTYYIHRAITSAKREKVPVFYCNEEGCIYFEFVFGQVSFHCSLWSDPKYQYVTIVDGYKWSGLHNSRILLIDAWEELKKIK